MLTQWLKKVIEFTLIYTGVAVSLCRDRKEEEQKEKQGGKGGQKIRVQKKYEIFKERQRKQSKTKRKVEIKKDRSRREEQTQKREKECE